MTALTDRKLKAPRIFTRELWSQYASETERPAGLFQGLSASQMVPSQDLSSATFRYRYGHVSPPGGFNPSPPSPPYLVESLANQWARITYEFDDGGGGTVEKTLFHGRIEAETRQVFATNTGDPASGIVEYTGYGPYRLLQKRFVSQSKWKDLTAPNNTINWIPPMNAFDERNTVIGNRSTNFTGPESVFQYSKEAEIWNNYDYCRYLIAEFLNSTDPNDPSWIIGGLNDELEVLLDLQNLQTPILWEETQTVADMLHQLIPRSAGFDWTIEYGEVGDPAVPVFYIRVFSLTPTDVTFGGSTIRANPNKFAYNTVNNPNQQIASFENSFSQVYNRARVIGNRVVVCGTFQRSATTTQLNDGWQAATQTAYQTAASSSNAIDNDDVRANDRFRDVFQVFNVVRNTGPLPDKYFPSVDFNGDFSFTSRALNQDLIRETLSWVPLQQGFDYTVDPPVDNSFGEVEPAFLPPIAFIQRAGEAEGGKFIHAERAGVGVSALPTDWGCQLYSAPNHLIASGKFTATFPTEVDPEYQFDFLALTIAWRADERFYMEATIGPGTGANADGRLDVFVPTAELWLVVPGTVVGVDESGNKLTAPDPGGLAIRNDKDKLEQAMAGVKARYQSERARASIGIKGIWDPALGGGWILESINDGAGTNEIAAVVTGIMWTFEADHESNVQTGYAGL